MASDKAVISPRGLRQIRRCLAERGVEYTPAQLEDEIDGMLGKLQAQMYLKFGMQLSKQQIYGLLRHGDIRLGGEPW